MTECRVFLKPKEDIRIRRGHPWVYHNEIGRFEGPIQSGEVASVFSAQGDFLGKGFLNTASKIFVRILSRDPDSVIDAAFFRALIRRAHQARLDLGYGESFRALFGEADGIPGLIVDRYGDILVVQILSLGIDLRKPMFTELLVEEFHPLGILERSDVSVRAKEGLPETVEVLYGTVPDTVIVAENGLKMAVDVRGGQKTGTFLDQRANHAALKPYVMDKTVLDCFSHAGGFGLHAAFYGAKAVECVDVSASAVRQIEANARLNGLTNVVALQADAFALLRSRLGEGVRYDVIILDPPAFTKTADKLDKAYAGYKEINLQAMKLLRPGGYLITCSCSQHMTPGLFLEMLGEAASDSGRLVQMTEFRIQGQDHPTLLGSEESLYLKCVILRVEDRC